MPRALVLAFLLLAGCTGEHTVKGSLFDRAPRAKEEVCSQMRVSRAWAKLDLLATCREGRTNRCKDAELAYQSGEQIYQTLCP